MKRRPFLILALLLSLIPSGCRLVKADPHTAFIGDSITQGWAYPQANYGVHGNTTSQMLSRFHADIPGHHYTTVVILGGTNDVLLNILPATTINNLHAIANATITARAKPILCEIPPIFHSFDKSNKVNYSLPVHSLNEMIQRLAFQNHWTLVDYYDAIRGHPDYSSDGVHMKRRGYAVMEWEFLKATWHSD